MPALEHEQFVPASLTGRQCTAPPVPPEPGPPSRLAEELEQPAVTPRTTAAVISTRSIEADDIAQQRQPMQLAPPSAVTEPVRQRRPYLAIEVLASTVVGALLGMEVLARHPSRGDFFSLDGFLFAGFVFASVAVLFVFWLPLSKRGSRKLGGALRIVRRSLDAAGGVRGRVQRPELGRARNRLVRVRRSGPRALVDAA